MKTEPREIPVADQASSEAERLAALIDAHYVTRQNLAAGQNDAAGQNLAAGQNDADGQSLESGQNDAGTVQIGDADPADLDRLAQLAADVGRVAPVRISPMARARIQTVLQDELSRHTATPRAAGETGRSGASRVRFGLMVRTFAGLCAVALAFGSAVAASASSLPGDTLYGVKRWRESVQLQLAAPSFEDRVQLRLALADERASEILALAKQGRPVPAAAVAGLVAADRELNLLTRSASPSTRETVAEITRRHEQAMRDLGPSDARLDEAADALAKLAPTPTPVSMQVAPTTAPAITPPTTGPVVSVTTAVPTATYRAPAGRPTTYAGATPGQTALPSANPPTAAPPTGGEPGGEAGGGAVPPAPTNPAAPTSEPADTPQPEATNPNAGERDRDLQTPPSTKRPGRP